jgi:sigma-54-specific transcriptional regulator
MSRPAATPAPPIHGLGSTIFPKMTAMTLDEIDAEPTAANPVQEPPTETLTHPNAAGMSTSVRASVLVFSDPRSRNLLRLIKQVAPSEVSLLIIGETGTGKELVARHIHQLSHRRHRAFAAVNCGALSDTLVDSELFGHEKGAFTGANEAKAGWFETANGGTLFLDEIGDLPPSMQVKLLRVLQEREVVRVGSRKPIPIDVRLIAATNVDLEDAVKAGRFRADLYYRIKVMTLPLAPLRDRPGDILPLSTYFLNRYGDRLGVDAELSDEAAAVLETYPWPGNIRELENVIHRAVLVSQNGLITVADLHLPEVAGSVESEPEPLVTIPDATSEPAGLRAVLTQLYAHDQPQLFERIQRTVITSAFEQCRRNQVQTANLLGISRNVLRTLLKRYGFITGG